MSSDFSIKPVGAPAAPPLVSAVSSTAHDAVRTQLPAAQTVSAVSATAFARNNPRVIPDPVSHQVVIDRAAASIVYQVIDERTNEVVGQFPEDATLRRRAYFRTLDLLKDSAKVIPTDRKV